MLPFKIEKQLNLLDFALSTLWRRRGRNTGIVVVFSVVIFLLASFQMTTRALTETAAAVLAQAPEITIQRISAGRQEALPLAYQDKLASIFGIRQVAPRIWGYQFDEIKGANYTVMGIEPGGMPLGNLLELTLQEGRFFSPGEEGAAVVGQAVRENLELADRRTFSLFRPDLSLKSFRLAGTFAPATDLLTSDLIVTSLADARDLFAIPDGLVTDLCVYVANPSEVQNIASKISQLLPDARVLTREQIHKTYQVVFGWRSGFGSICLLAALAAFAILAWDKASGLAPEERREISILKILGWQTSDVLAIRFLESLLLSGLALVIGCFLAYLHVVYFGAALFRPVMVGWSVLFPRLILVPQVVMADLLLIFAFTVPPYLAATIIPAWRAAAVPPDSAIR